MPALYDDLVSWYRLLDPTEDHVEEAARWQAAFERAVPSCHTLLELGAGAGNNAHCLSQRFRCTLTDVSGAMLDLSRAINPRCEHIVGDMRTLRLEREFDAVLVQDAVVYMTSEADLRAAAATAFAHTRPGGAALFAPDHVRETFHERSDLLRGDDGARSLRCIEWFWDPNPADDTHAVDFAFLLRDGADVRSVHDRHIAGLFSRERWTRILSEVGYQVEILRRASEQGEADDLFVCRRAPTP